MLTVRERYERDQIFRTMVDSLLWAIEALEITPTEAREAAMLAQLMYEERHPRPILYGYSLKDRGFYPVSPAVQVNFPVSGNEHQWGPVRTTIPAEPLTTEEFALLGGQTKQEILKRVFGMTTKTYRVCLRCGRSDVYLKSIGKEDECQ